MHTIIPAGTANDEHDLVARARAGDRQAFEVLYRRTVGRVHAVCLRIVADGARAEELTQEAYIRAWGMIGSFRGESAFSTWLHRLAVNVVLVDLRSGRRRTARVETVADVTLYEDAAARAPSHELRMDLEQAIAQLPPQARAVFVLHDVEGYRHDEIAEMMGVAVGTSKAQLHRARMLLKESLQ